MKTFEDLTFEPYPGTENMPKSFKQQGIGLNNATLAFMNFPNGYGVQVFFGIRFNSDGRSNYEVRVSYKGFVIPYFLYSDFIGYQTQEQVTGIMKEVQELKN